MNRVAKELGRSASFFLRPRPPQRRETQVSLRVPYGERGERELSPEEPAAVPSAFRRFHLPVGDRERPIVSAPVRRARGRSRTASNLGDHSRSPALLGAYVDETGDRGFTTKSSPIFGITAVLVADELDAMMRSAVTTLRSDFGVEGVPLLWSRYCGPAHHDRRRHVARTLAKVPGLQAIYVMIDKLRSPDSAAMRTDQRLAYNYVARLAFERIALAARAWHGGSRRAVVRVAHVKGHVWAIR